MYEDKRLHLLASDVIYCTYHHNLSGDLAVMRKVIKQSATPVAWQTTDIRQEDTLALESALRQTQEAEESFTHPQLVGIEVHHRIFGDGRIVLQAGDAITVRFPNDDRQLQLPSAFSRGYLATADTSIVETYTRLECIIETRKEQEAKLRSAQSRNRRKNH